MSQGLQIHKELSPEEKRALLARLLKERVAPSIPAFPLSYGQQGLWLLHQLAPESAAYNIVFAARIQPPLNVGALQNAWRGVIERHAMLRSVVRIGRNGPMQSVRGSLDSLLELVDAINWKEEELQARLQEESRRPFTLEERPVRALLFTRPTGESVFLFVVHHVAFDAWSLGILLRELCMRYEALMLGKPLLLPPLPADYRDFVEWQANFLTGQDGEASWFFWRDHLCGELPVLELPTDHPRPPHASFRGATHDFTLDSRFVSAVRALAQQEGTTPFSVLLAVFGTLLHRYSGQTDLLIGSPTAGRARAEFEGLVGYFVNPVVIRADVEGNPTFTEFLARVGSRVRDALRHADFPFPLLVQRLRPDRDPSRSPIFDVMFNYLRLGQFGLQGKNSRASSVGSSLVLDPISLPQQEGQFDLSLDVVDTDESFICSLKYRTDLFERATIERMAGHYEQLLTAILADPTRHVSILPLLTEAERVQILVEWNRTATPYPHDKTIHTLFEQQVAHTPDEVAVTYEDDELTFGELNARANQVANRLRNLGVGRDALVGLCVERSVDLLVGLFGILKAGGAYLPLDPSYPPARLAHMLVDSQASVVVTASADTRRPAAINARAVVEQLRSEVESGWTVVDLRAERHALAALPTVNLQHSTQSRDLAYVIYTSGSTGRPKGVMISHRSALHLAAASKRAIYDRYPGAGMRITLNAPLSFDASVKQIVMMIYGHSLDILPQEIRFDAGALVEYIRRRRIDVVDCVPSQLRLLLEAGFLNGNGWMPRLVLVGGEAIDDATWRTLAAAPGTDFFNMYGPTECTVVSTTANVLTAPDRATIGKPLSNVRCYVLDKHDQPVPVGIPGELHIGGAGVGRGYLNQPDLTAEKFIQDPFVGSGGGPEAGMLEARLYRTGDLVRFRPDGNIEFLARMDGQIKVRGFRIELGEIESVLGQHPAVQEAVVALREDVPGDKRLVAYWVAAQQSALSVGALRNFLREKLPDYMVPIAFVALDRLPLTSNGKVDKRALASLGPIPSAPQGGGEPIGDPVGYQIAQIWQDVLGCGPVGLDDNFFDLGGHSLLAVRMIQSIERIFGKRLPVSTLFAGATIRHLAGALLEQSRESFKSPLMPVQAGGCRPPFFFLHGDYSGGGFYCREMARHLGPEQPFYVLHPQGLDGGTVPPTIEAMADEHVRTLRAFRPTGPYLLGGLCGGGLVAFEMARRLRIQGERVDFLVMIDSRIASARFWWLQLLIKWVAPACGLKPVGQQAIFLALRVSFATVGRKLAALRTNPRGILLKIYQQLRGHRPPRYTYSNLDIAYGRANYSYLPRRYPGRVTVLLSEDGVRNRYDRDWQGRAEEVEVHRIPGTHIESITRNIHSVAERVKACLDAVQERGG